MRDLWARTRVLVFGEYTDLYILAVVALALAVLGATGLSDNDVLTSVTLGVLAVLSLSQVRTRRHIGELAQIHRSGGGSMLLRDFPEDLWARRARASDYLFVGVAMRTTLATSAVEFRQILVKGGRLRVLLIDPTDDRVLTEAHERRHDQPTVERLRAAVEATLDELVTLRDRTGGRLEIRVSGSVPAAGMNVVDPESSAGLVVVQHYEYRSNAFATPIIRLEAGDGYWYRHFVDEAERQWADGSAWPLEPAARAKRAPRPSFSADFGPEFTSTLDRSSEVLVTGIARNTLITSQYNKFERLLLRGCSIRVLLLDPDCPAVKTAADRYYADRSPNVLQARIAHTVSMLTEMAAKTGGDLSVRLTQYPIGLGIIASNAGPTRRSDDAVLLAEYYTYQALREPKFVLTPSDGVWFDHLFGEAEALWAGARPA